MPLTSSQQQAVTARGNVLVMAGAGTGKTRTLVERCLRCLDDGASLDELLVVTFTEAAAAEMRERLRRELEERAATTSDPRWAEQLALFDRAHIGTLHGFCFQLVRQHFHELGLDPMVSVMDDGQARILAAETLDALFERHYNSRETFSGSVRQLIELHGNGRDDDIRRLVLKLHHYTQARPDPDGWFQKQSAAWNDSEPAQWREWFIAGARDWRERWLPGLESLSAENVKAAECRAILGGVTFINAKETGDALVRIKTAGGTWPKGKKVVLEKPLKTFFAEAELLASFMPDNGKDPLTTDWQCAREPMKALLGLAQEFSSRFAEAKRELGGLDFHDLEQFALRLLRDFKAGGPTDIARHWRGRLRFVFVDEYQDINAAQDCIITALSRDGAESNRFLVGDVKQSIYRFRLADPKIFQQYAGDWQTKGTNIPLAENFRSREGILGFVNSVFELLMRAEVGGVTYDDAARLQFGAAKERKVLSAEEDPAPRVHFHLRLKNGAAEGDDAADETLAGLADSEIEARLVGLQLRELRATGHKIRDEKLKTFRAADWSDMAVLLRSPSNRAEGFAKQFAQLGIPLVVERGGFFDSTEVTDLLSLLQVLDNPLQDVPLLAVLRSPLVGLSLDDLALARLLAKGRFWGALIRCREPGDKLCGKLTADVGLFLERFHRWRRLARQESLSRCLDAVLAETHYADWLVAQDRGAQRRANVEKLLGLAQQFDQFQRQGLFRFLRFIEAQRDAEVEPEAAATTNRNAVRLMSVHQSKGLEFPVVALANLGGLFNERDLSADIILDETYGLCPQIQPPEAAARFPSLPHWLARQRQKRELRGEELRLLYVAMTRARDTLLLTAGISEKAWKTRWQNADVVTAQAIAGARSHADWLALWFARSAGNTKSPPLVTWQLHEDFKPVDEEAGDGAIDEESVGDLDAATTGEIRRVVEWQYPFAAATHRPAKTSVTALRRAAMDEENEAETLFKVPRSRFKAARYRERDGKLSATDIGTAHHLFLQFVELERAGDESSLRAEAERLRSTGALTPEQAGALDFRALATFWNSETGREIRACAADVNRELPFTARFSTAEVDELIRPDTESVAGISNGDFVVVQGVADLVVNRRDEIWLLDFKTDDVDEGGLAEKSVEYSVQLRLYALALGRIYRKPVTKCLLHFLVAGRSVDVDVS